VFYFVEGATRGSENWEMRMMGNGWRNAVAMEIKVGRCFRGNENEKYYGDKENV
jgi:hypothetical protein